MSVEIDESKIAQIALLIAQISAISYRDALEALTDFERLRSRAEKAEAKVRAVEAECDRLAAHRGGWDPDIAKLFRGVLRSTDEDGQT